jgi:hypothetical protein
MSLLDQLQPPINPPPISAWPPAPGWWVLLALLPVLGWGLWRLRRFLPKPEVEAKAEQPLDPMRLEALAELARPAPGCSRSTRCSSACAATTTPTPRATPSTVDNGWHSSTTAAPLPA